MERNKVSRLNRLFEKMMSDNANVLEKRELTNLYQEYINDGRENSSKSRVASSTQNMAMS